MRATTTPLPEGFHLRIDPETKELDERTLFGGAPVRALRLSPAGRRAWAEVRDGPVRSTAGGVLARRLTDAGLAHPRPPALAGPADVTVVVPARDRRTYLARCLDSLDGAHPVVVVDDGSSDPRAVAELAARHGATLVRRPESGGPAAARNTGLAAVASEFVAFLDSDCVASPGWIETLAAHFADPLVAAVAPRIATVPSPSAAGRYTAARGGLGIGARESRVAPGSRVPYVPTAALLVRCDALRSCAREGHVFDPDLRYGEDVDLVWRLDEAGWRVRCDPAAAVEHHDPETWTGLFDRRFHYGTGAAPLALRHPGASGPLALHPWPTLTSAALLARRPGLAAASFAASVQAMNRTLRAAELPVRGVPGAMATGVHQTWLGIGRYTTQFAAPLLAGALVRPGGATPLRRWGRRAAVASLLLGPPLKAYREHRPALDPFRFVLGHVADDIAYGLGVWAGSVRARTSVALRPVVAWRPFRIELARPGRELLPGERHIAPPPTTGARPAPPDPKGTL